MSEMAGLKPDVGATLSAVCANEENAARHKPVAAMRETNMESPAINDERKHRRASAQRPKRTVQINAGGGARARKYAVCWRSARAGNAATTCCSPLKCGCGSWCDGNAAPTWAKA